MDPSPAPAPTPSQGAGPAFTRPRGRLRAMLPLAAVLFLLGLALAGLAQGGRWLLFNETGSAWLLRQLPQVQATGFKGAWFGPGWQAERLRVAWDGGRQWLVIEGLAAQGLRWSWRPHAQAWFGLQVQHLQVDKLVLHGAAPQSDAPAWPADLDWPLQFGITEARVRSLQIGDAPPVQALHLIGLSLDARAGHRLEQVALEWRGLRLQAQLGLGAAHPVVVSAEATLRPLAGGDNPAWAAALHLQGDLQDLVLQGSLRGVPRPGRQAPVLDLQARVRPQQAWPLDTLELHTQALDLSALWAGAPQTRIAGHARLAGRAAGAPLQAQVALQNRLPGRWNEGRLPLRQLDAELRGRLDQPDRLELPRFEARFADATRDAGRWSGSARWQDRALTLHSTLVELAPQALDGRAAPMVLSGPLNATLRGLPSPDPSVGATATALSLRWDLDLQGTLQGALQAVQLQMQGQTAPGRLELQQLRLHSGRASAEITALLERQRRGEWQLRTRGSLADFDPLPWWPGPAGSAWREGGHRLSADWQLDLRLPEVPDRLPPLAWVQRLAGNGSLRLHSSQLAGVPVAAQLSLAYGQPETRNPAALRGEVQLGTSRLAFEGLGDPVGPGGAEQLRLSLGAADLATLAPLFRLWPETAGWAPRRGSGDAVLAIDGRWPALRSEGRLTLRGLQAGTLELDSASAQWQLDAGTDPDAGPVLDRPLLVRAELNGVGIAGLAAQRLRAELRGTLASHRIEASGTWPVQPPAQWLRVAGLDAARGTQARLAASGAWQTEPAGGGRWRAQVERIDLGSWDGSADAAAPSTRWASAAELRAELRFDAAGRLRALQAEPGRLQLGPLLAMRWDAVRVDFGDALPQIALRAEIDPFAVAPLLARWQPTMGWQGDLRLAARLDIRAAETLQADVSFERVDGDLQVDGADGPLLLGMSELRLALSAHDGQWLFTPRFRGRTLGEIGGEVRVSTSPERRWPDADAPLSGAVVAHVADLGIWGAWVPVGWRLVGQLRSTASLGGRFGSPLVTGVISGSGLGLRNLLAGVNIADGRVHIRLEGDNASIEHFELRGGDGTLVISGGATLGRDPQAQLHIVAQNFRVLGRVDRNLSASGQADLRLSRALGRLDGRIHIDEGGFDLSRSDAPSLDEDVTVYRAEPEAAAAAAVPQPALRPDFVLALDVDLGRQLHVRGRGLEALLRGSLHLGTPGGRLAVHGTVNAVDGTYAAYGQRLEIERGILGFSGSADNPRLDVLALRPHTDVVVGVQITGELQAPRVRLYADPELGDQEKLSWLVLGRAPDGLGRADTALLQRAAVALLAGEGEAPTDRLMRNLGIDEISLRQAEGDVRETVVTLGKQLSRRWYVGYERGVNSTTGTWQLIYRIAQRFTLRAQSGLDSSLDMIWVWRVQEVPADAGVRKSVVTPP